MLYTKSAPGGILKGGRLCGGSKQRSAPPLRLLLIDFLAEARKPPPGGTQPKYGQGCYTKAPASARQTAQRFRPRVCTAPHQSGLRPASITFYGIAATGSDAPPQGKAFVQRKPPRKSEAVLFVLALPIFPASHPASIVGADELNFCVRDGNRWTLVAINTNSCRLHKAAVMSKAGAFNLWCAFRDSNPGPTD